MPTATANHAPGPELCQQVEAYLWQERERIYAEIHAYPPPIPACDAQFNYLIEERAFVAQELNRVRGLAETALHADRRNHLLYEYVATSRILNQAVKTQILTVLNQTTRSTTNQKE